MRGAMAFPVPRSWVPHLAAQTNGLVKEEQRDCRLQGREAVARRDAVLLIWHAAQDGKMGQSMCSTMQAYDQGALHG